MFTTQLYVFKMEQQELERQAAKFRLIKALVKPNPWAAGIAQVLGRTLIRSGQGLIKGSQAAF